VKLITSIFLVLLIFNSRAEGQNFVIPRLEPETKALEFYKLGRKNSSQPVYTWTEFAQISLWASGDNTSSNFEKIRTMANNVINSKELPVSQKEKAEFILTYLHSNVLKTYQLNQTRVDIILSNGRYNCVSSAVLYMILCEAAGIATSGVVTRDHALVTVHINGEDIDVETTNRYGFDPGNRKEFHDQFGRLTGFSYVPARNYRDRQTISKIELVSLIINNRISEHEKQNRFTDAVPLSIDRAALLLGESLADNSAAGPQDSLFEDPRKELMERLFNYGAWLLRSNREEDCIRWANAASVRYSDPDHWQEFAMAAVNNRIARYIKENKTAEARDFLSNQKINLTDSNYIQLDNLLTDAELLRRANQIKNLSEGDAVVSAIEKERRKIGEKRALELRTFSVLKTASLLSAAPDRNWNAAIQYIEKALSDFGSNRDLEHALITYQSNLATDFHNRFAAEWNRKNYEEAQRILNEGLSEFPNDRQLLADRDIVNRNQ